MSCIFGFSMENHNYWCSAKKFWQGMSLQKVKKHPKMASLPLFWHTESSLGRMKIWRGKWAPNSKIPVGLESIQDRLSKKPTWAHFGHLKVTQNSPQSSKAHRENGAAHRGKIAQFASVSWNFGSRLLQVGPLIYTSVFWHQRWNLKCFFSRLAYIQVAKEGKRSPKPNVMFVVLHL